MKPKSFVRSLKSGGGQSLKLGQQSKGIRPQLRGVTQLQMLINRQDYTGVLKIVTPSFFRDALSDTTTRPILLRIEKDLFQQAQRLLREGDFKAAEKLLKQVIRLGGKFRAQAEKLIQKAQTKAGTEGGIIRIRLTGPTKKAVKKNGGGTRAPKPSRAESVAGKRAVAAKKPAEEPARPRPTRAAPPAAAMPSRTRGLAQPAPTAPAQGPAPQESRPVSARPPEAAPPPPPQDVGFGAPGESFGALRGNGEPQQPAATAETMTEGGVRRGSPKKEQTEVLRRTPHMDLSPDAPLEPKTEFKVYVSVDAAPAKPGEQSEDVVVRGPKSQNEFPLQVTLVVSEHFELRDLSPKPITIYRSRKSAQVIFKVRCADEFPAEPDAALSALFTYEGHPSGRVTRRFRVENDKLVAAMPTTTAAVSPSPRPAAMPPAVAVVTGLDPYDLVIGVAGTKENDFRHYQLVVDAPAIGQHLEVAWNLNENTNEIVSNYMKDFVAEGLEPSTRLAQLKGAGVQLFRATPPEFQKLFWEMIDAGKPPKTILVVSDDPYIPWELMVPRRTVAGQPVTHPPLGVEFCVGRWIRGDYTSPPQQIPLDRTYVVAPHYVIDSKNLKHAPEEAAFVCSNFKPSTAIDPADFDKIKKALSEHGVSLMHFICHGAADSAQQTVYLRDMVNNLSASVVEGCDEFVAAFSHDHTFVFLNACEVGRAAPALAGVNGLPAAFLRLGASGVVAALWSVKDDLAHQVAETFYKAVLQKPQTPFAEILRSIRAQAYAGEAEDTYAAYCFYGSPLARRV